VKRWVLGLILISFIFMGCIGEEPEEEIDPCGGLICPNGYFLSEQCACLRDFSKNQTYSVSDNSTIKVFDNSYKLKLIPVLDGCEEQGLIVDMIGDENYTFEDQMTLEGSQNNVLLSGILSLNNFSYDIETHSEECEYAGPYTTLKVYQSLDIEDEVELNEGKTHNLETGNLKLNEVVISADKINAFDKQISLNQGDTEKIGDSDYTLKLSDVEIKTSKVRAAINTVTKEQGMMATFPGDYAVVVSNIGYTINPSPVATTDRVMGVDDQFTSSDNSIISINTINAVLNDCNDTCSVNSSWVSVKVKPKGTGSFKTYILNETDYLNVSDKLRIQIRDIDITVDANCTNGTGDCTITRRRVSVRFLSVGDECTTTNKRTTFQITYPNTETTSVTLNAGEEYQLSSGLVLTLQSVLLDLSNPDYGGNCEVENVNSTFSFSPPEYECQITSKRAKVTVDRFGEKSDLWVNINQSKTLLGADINVHDISADVELSGSTCRVSNKAAVIDVSRPVYCKINSERARVQPNNGDIESIKKLDTFKVGESEIQLLKVEYELDSSCIAKEKSAFFEIKSPKVNEFDIYAGDRKVAGMFDIKAEEIEMTTKIEGNSCSLIDRRVFVVVDTDYDRVSKWMQINDELLIGGGKIIVKDISADYPNELDRWCTTSNITAVLGWMPQ